MAPLMRALTICAYSLTAVPIMPLSMFPGGIGLGNRRQDALNRQKNTINISVPLMASNSGNLGKWIWVAKGIG